MCRGCFLNFKTSVDIFSIANKRSALIIPDSGKDVNFYAFYFDVYVFHAVDSVDSDDEEDISSASEASNIIQNSKFKNFNYQL